jgi:hypothetical protein
MVQMIDMTGKRYGRLVVLSLHPERRNGQALWNCVCDCGTTIIVRGHHLRHGQQSCGCLVAEVGKKNKTHGLALHPLYQVWRGMMKRCYDPEWKNYEDYGGRGIKVCKQWHDVRSFISDMDNDYKQTLMLERRDNSADYSPDNCTWATPLEQANNKRNNRVITFNGKTQTLQQWSRETGIHYRTINSRLDLMGWPVEKALTTPPRSTGR